MDCACWGLRCVSLECVSERVMEIKRVVERKWDGGELEDRQRDGEWEILVACYGVKE